MKEPLVSVLMPAFNAEKYIGQAIESILNQSFKDFELIIADDYSTDNTWKIIEKYVKRDKRIKAIKNKKNLYIAGNRNKLIKLAQGKYIAWQDADDISLPKRIEHQYEFMEKYPSVGIVGGYLQFFDDKGNSSIRKYALDDKTLRKYIFRFSPVAQPSAMIRKRCFDEFGYYNLKYPPAEDIDMSFRIGTKYKFANLQEIVIKYRETNNSATFKKLKKIELDTITIRKKYSKNIYYPMNFIDKLYNLIQYFSVFLVPAKLRIAIFNLMRNSR